MNIEILTNTYGKYHRQNVAMESLIYLQTGYSRAQVIARNIQFKDDEDTFTDGYFGIDTYFVLPRSSLDFIPTAEKKLPVVYDLFDSASDNCDYFIFTNSDVIIQPNLLDYIVDFQPDAMAVSRLDIEHIDSYKSVLDQKLVPVRYEIAGFDVFVFKKTWWNDNKHLFNYNFFLGKPAFDVCFAGIIVQNAPKFEIYSGFPPMAFHIHHGISSVTTDCPERDHNLAILKRPELLLADNIMFYNLQYNLCRRRPWGIFLHVLDGEEQRQRDFFNTINIHQPNNIRPIL